MSEHLHPVDHDELEFLQDFIRAAKSDVPSEADCQATQKRLMETLQTQSQNKETSIMNLFTSLRVVRYAAAVALVALFVVGAMTFYPGGTNVNQAYADIIEQIRKARSLTYTVGAQIKGQPEMKFKMLYKEPGLLRQEFALDTYAVIDLNQQKGLSVLPMLKQYMEMDLGQTQANTMALDLVDHMRRLPERANAVLEAKEMDGRIVQGFKVTEQGMNQEVWVDVQSGDLVRIEGEFVNAPGMNMVMQDFAFDVVLDDSLFSLTPPADFKKLVVETSLPGEKDLLYLLDYWISHDTTGTFPPSLNPAEITPLIMEKLKDGTFKVEAETGITQDQIMEKTIDQAQKLNRAYMYMLGMKPENDWHYTGEGKKVGEKDTPLCWWKPDGSDSYRVIFCDLHVEDVASTALLK